jgi:O-antigen/teichoic acid export membrane protein
LLLAAVGGLGIPLLLLAEIEGVEPEERRVMLTTGMAISGGVVLVLAIGTMGLSPLLGKSLSVIGGNPLTAALFVIGSVATMSALTVDNAAVGLHRGAALLWRGSLGSLLKIAIVGVLVLAATRNYTGLIFAWTLATILSVVICVPMLALDRTQPGQGSLTNRLALARRFGKLSLQHHVLNLSIASVTYAVPLMATLLISPEELAYFTAAYLIAAAMLYLPYLLALSLFAERSGDPDQLRRHVRRTFPLGLALAGAIVLVIEIAAPYVLRLFGPAYPAGGATALRLLILVAPAYVVKDHYVSIYRAQYRMSHASKVMAVGTTVEVIGAAVGGALWGLTGICAGWAIFAWCEAFVLLPGVLKAYRKVPNPAPSEQENTTAYGGASRESRA